MAIIKMPKKLFLSGFISIFRGTHGEDDFGWAERTREIWMPHGGTLFFRLSVNGVDLYLIDVYFTI